MHRTALILIPALVTPALLASKPRITLPSRDRAPRVETPTERPERPRILITNDNGIDDPKLIALARACATRAETWVVAPREDRSGSGAFLSLPRTGAIAVEPRDLGDEIEAFAVDGTPADCVFVALAGILLDHPPTLVISGINGGPNLGAEWMFSGTVGAARVAALGGFPAIAVSGLDDDVPGAVAAAVDWVVRLAEHPIVRELAPGEYLTVSLPRVAPSEVRGVHIADRAPLRRGPSLDYDEDAGVWKMTGMISREATLSTIADEWFHENDSIAVVPMRVDEVNGARLLQWLRYDPELPAWQTAERVR